MPTDIIFVPVLPPTYHSSFNSITPHTIILYRGGSRASGGWLQNVHACHAVHLEHRAREMADF